jgi:hypothetical protein
LYLKSHAAAVESIIEMTRRALPALTLLCAAALLGAAPVAHASFGVSLWEAGTCEHTTCTYASVEKEREEKAGKSDAFTQAAGHPKWGMTTFELSSKETILKQKEPEGAPLKRVRVDVPPGLASNPQAPLEEGKKCTIADFEATPPKCPEGTEVGADEAIVFIGGLNAPAAGTVYNLEPEAGEAFGLKLKPMPLLFGIAIQVKPETGPLPPLERSFLQGFVDWPGDYHEYFEIDNLSEKTPILRSKLNFNGQAGGNFITLPSECSSTTTNDIELESWTGEIAHAVTHTPVGVEGCSAVPFAPTVEVKPETSQSDSPDGATVQVNVPQKTGASEINSGDVKDAHVTLPDGLTLNASAARGLEGCTPSEIGIGSTEPVACPAASKVGEVTIEADLPEKSLVGNVYLGKPEAGPITGPPFTIYVDAESAKYGISVRLQGQVNPDPTTGRLETTFLENPQQPFSEFILKSNGGPLAPLANPLSCEGGEIEATFTPFTGEPPALSSSAFASTGCPSSLPFALTASASHSPTNAGAHTAYTFSLAREDGQQYLSRISTTLPAGLVGTIPTVPLCGEPQAAAGTCGSASQIGTATVAVGAGAEPYTFSGPVFLTGPYGGAPFGLSVAVPVLAGPFDFGTIVTRASISVDPSTARVTVAGNVPTIVAGVPSRIRSVTVAVERPGFLINPTNCGEASTDTVLSSTLGATQGIKTPFATSACSALAFSPVFTAATDAHTSKANGASLRTTITQGAGQANIRSVTVQLPLLLASRLTTLQQACPEATFAAGPAGCPAGSNVGTATASTPTLPGTLTGPAYLVSHGGAAFPDLDIILEGSGVRVVLVGNTNIKGGVTTTTFAAVPDVPASSFTLDLPTGPHSALTATGDVCASPLVMPTTIVAQNGATLHQNTTVAVSGCGTSRGVKILSRRVRGHTLLLRVRTFAAGRVSARGRYLKSISRRLRAAGTTTLKVPLAHSGLSRLRKRHRLRIHVRVSFRPSAAGLRASTASSAATFKH